MQSSVEFNNFSFNFVEIKSVFILDVKEFQSISNSLLLASCYYWWSTRSFSTMALLSSKISSQTLHSK